jgi:pimeloyl-ACP methyl ester carboxylesterase
MDPTRKGQKWILDAFIGAGGMGVLHPESNYFREQLGYNSYDLKRVFELAKSTQMMTAAWATVAKEIEGRAAYWLARGSQSAALALFERAMLLYGRAHYSIAGNPERRQKYLAKLTHCRNRVAALSPHRIEHVVLPLERSNIYSLFETAPGTRNAPCVILLSGMDMFKENWHRFMTGNVLPRGWSGFTLDGPGQGESLTHGVTMTLDNYDGAISAAIDWLATRPEVDPTKIVVMGSSMGSWWGTHALPTEKRIKALAANMPCLADKSILLNQAQPSFVANLMSMTGLGSYEEISEFAGKMSLKDRVGKIQIPYLIVTGENDELTTLEGTREIYDLLPGPKELWVYQREFHPIGPPANEWLNASMDWLQKAIDGKIEKGWRYQVFITKDGEYIEGDGTPPWWNPE